MPRAGPSKSQRAHREPQASQHEAQRSRGGRRAATEESDDDAGEELDMDVDAAQARTPYSDDNLEKKACDLVRLALFTEHKRVPLRREDINKKVLGSNTRAFNTVLEKAQILLRKTFAMELVELQARNYREHDPDGDLQNATGVKKKAAAAGSKTYILRSTLNIAIIDQAALSNEQLLEEELAEGPPDENDDEDMPRNYGSIISWSRADQLAALGLLHVILALILVNGRSISELDLRANLKRLRIPSSGTVPTNAQSTHKSMPVDTYLTQLMRQGYIDRVRLGENKVAGGKRGRPSVAQANAEDNQAYEWRWGNRAYSEIGEKAVASFVAEFMIERTMDDDADEDEEENGVPARGRKKRRQKEGGAAKRLETMVKAIERAAGGNLADIK